MERLYDDYWTLTPAGEKVNNEAKLMFTVIEEFIENNYDKYPMKELQELLCMHIEVSCTVARMKAKRKHLRGIRNEV